MRAIHHPHITHLHHNNHQLSKNRVPMVYASQDVKTSKKSNRLGETLSNLLNIQKPYQKNKVLYILIGTLWTFMKIRPTHLPCPLRGTYPIDGATFMVFKNGKDFLIQSTRCFVEKLSNMGNLLKQTTYDALDFDPFSEYCGSCMYKSHIACKFIFIHTIIHDISMWYA